MSLDELLAQMEEEVAKDIAAITDEDLMNPADYMSAHKDNADILADLGL